MTDDQLTPEERAELLGVYAERAAPDGMEDRVVAALPTPDRRTTDPTSRSPWLRIAAGVLLFLGGYALGGLRVGPSAPGDVPASPAGVEPEPFVLLLHEALEAPAIGTAEEDAVVERYRAWGAEAARAGAVTGSRLSDRSVMVTAADPDAPLIEGVVGFFTVEAATWEDAEALARSHPHREEGGWVEVRRVVPVPDG